MASRLTRHDKYRFESTRSFIPRACLAMFCLIVLNLVSRFPANYVCLIMGFYFIFATVITIQILTAAHTVILERLQQSLLTLVKMSDADEDAIQHFARQQNDAEAMMQTSQSTMAPLIYLMLAQSVIGMLTFGVLATTRKLPNEQAMNGILAFGCAYAGVFVMQALVDVGDAYANMVKKLHGPEVAALDSDFGTVDYYSLSTTACANCWTIMTFQVDSVSIIGFSSSMALAVIFTFQQPIIDAVLMPGQSRR